MPEATPVSIVTFGFKNLTKKYISLVQAPPPSFTFIFFNFSFEYFKI